MLAPVSDDLQKKNLKLRFDSDHSKRVGECAYNLSKFIGLKEREAIFYKFAGLYHDIGKIKIPSTIIDKPSALTKEEFEVIKMHPVYSYEILKQRGIDELICKAVLHHHENFDSSGYPHRLGGEDIPLGGRMLKIIDCYDALLSQRVYKDALDKPTAIKIMLDEVHKFDPVLLKHFFKLIVFNGGKKK